MGSGGEGGQVDDGMGGEGDVLCSVISSEVCAEVCDGNWSICLSFDQLVNQ